MDAREFTRWKGFYRVSPFGDWRADLRQGRTTAAIYNVHRTGNSDRANALDFVYEYKPALPEQTPAEVELAIDGAFGKLVSK